MILLYKFIYFRLPTSQALLNWNDSFSIGSVYLKYAEDILKAYPPYINYFEDSKKKLQELDRTNPRFHAFLKICESKQVRNQTLTWSRSQSTFPNSLLQEKLFAFTGDQTLGDIQWKLRLRQLALI